jgi:hypothetical protein
MIGDWVISLIAQSLSIVIAKSPNANRQSLNRSITNNSYHPITYRPLTNWRSSVPHCCTTRSSRGTSALFSMMKFPCGSTS